MAELAPCHLELEHCHLLCLVVVQLIGGQRLIKLQHQLALYPDKLWDNNWMDGFNFFVNVDRVQINIKQFETILMKSKEFAEKSENLKKQN